MRVYPIKYKDMNVKYLMTLFDQKNLNTEEVSKIIINKLQKVRLIDLLKRWNKEKNVTLKELLEIAIAKKIVNYTLICTYTELSNLVNRFLSKMTSLDAICILSNSYNEQIKECAYQKYHEVLDAYLDTFEKDDYKLYLTEGDDTQLQIKIIEYKKRGRR